MKLELSVEEMAIIMDGLAALPLAKSYNVFNKVLKEYQSAQSPMVIKPIGSNSEIGSEENTDTTTATT